MDRRETGIRIVLGLAGAALIVSAFLPWAQIDGSDVSGWNFASATAVVVSWTGLVSLAVAATGGWSGLFRPDVSLRGAADLFAVLSTIAVGCLILFDLSQDAEIAPGAVVALISAVAVAGVCGDYRVMRGAPLFPSLPQRNER